MVVPERHGYLDGVGISSILVFPLIVEGEYLGYVCVSRDRGSAAYSDRGIALAEDVAGRIALAIGQARGSQVRRQRTREQQAQLALGVTALGSGDVEELYAAAVTCVADALGGDWVEVAELEGGELVSRATVGDSPDHQRVPVCASSYARAVLDADQPVVVYDLSQTPGLTLSPQARRQGMHSGMAVAIRSPDEMLGVLAVHQRRPRRFSAEERDFLQAVATTVAGGLVRRRADAQLSWRAHHDPLTGLAKAILLLDRLQHRDPARPPRRHDHSGDVPRPGRLQGRQRPAGARRG